MEENFKIDPFDDGDGTLEDEVEVSMRLVEFLEKRGARVSEEVKKILKEPLGPEENLDVVLMGEHELGTIPPVRFQIPPSRKPRLADYDADYTDDPKDTRSFLFNSDFREF